MRISLLKVGICVLWAYLKKSKFTLAHAISHSVPFYIQSPRAPKIPFDIEGLCYRRPDAIIEGEQRDKSVFAKERFLKGFPGLRKYP